METLGLLGVGQGSSGSPRDLVLQGEHGGEGPEFEGKGEVSLLPDQGPLSPMPETTGASREAAAGGLVGVGWGGGLAGSKWPRPSSASVGVGDNLTSPYPPPALSSLSLRR